MTCPTSESITPVNQVTRNNDNPNNSPSLQDQILDHVSSLKSLIKKHNERPETLIKPIHLSFSDEDGSDKRKGVDKGSRDAEDEDLQKPYKEVLRSPFTDNWADLREKITEMFALRRRCFKDPTEVSKIIQRANEMLEDFKERWMDEMSYIQDVLENERRRGLDERPNNLPPIPADDVLDKSLIVEAEVEGLTEIRDLRAVSSTINAMMKFPTPRGITTLVAQTASIFKCQRLEEKRTVQEEKDEEKKPKRQENPKGGSPHQPSILGTESYDQDAVLQRMPTSIDKPSKGQPQKRRVLGTKKSMTVMKEVEEWVKVGIVRLVQYPTWISNPILVNKVDDIWRMCIDFKNINSVCPKDYYPLPEIDLKIKSVMRFHFKCFLDAYKGYHQIQMFKEDEEKNALYTDQWTYCYTKMSFGFKNIGATYHRWTEDAKCAFQEMKKLIMNLPSLTTPVPNEILYVYKTHASMTRCLAKAKEHMVIFEKFSIQNILGTRIIKPEVNTIVEEEGDNRMTPIIRCLEERVWPEDEKEARNLRMKINQYIMEEGVLFKKLYLAGTCWFVLMSYGYLYC
nr:hypothetical protein [Tanacetum cinerariifolium]